MKWLPVMALCLLACNPKIGEGLRKNDLKKDVLLITTKGEIRLRLYEETPLHRENFLRLVNQSFYDSILFHRVIRNFMIQAGDPDSKRAGQNQELGEGDLGYTIPAEFQPQYFHHKGALAAARTSDDINPKKASSAAQFYIVTGMKFTDAGLDSVEQFRLKGRKIPVGHRAVYKELGGAPHLDQNYTVFGEVVTGQAVVDYIAAVKTTGPDGNDRPIEPIRIIRARLVKKQGTE